jgi:hypothetical protein
MMLAPMAGMGQEKTLDGTQGRTLGQSVGSPISGVKPPGFGRASASAHDPRLTSTARSWALRSLEAIDECVKIRGPS